MAAAGVGDVEYESDPEEGKQSLVMRRRRAASDDEDSGEEGEGAEQERDGLDGVARNHQSDGESDGQGGAADYDDEEDEEYINEEDEEVYHEEEEELIGDGQMQRRDLGNGNARDGVGDENIDASTGVSENAAEEFGDAPQEGQVNQEGEKKPNEPYAVPTAGAFYMHDDRFRDSSGGRHRRTFGGRRLWESKDERKWGHDKFEEFSIQERHYDERRRNTRGQARGRGRNRGVDRSYVRGNRSMSFDNNSSSGAATNNNNNQAPVPRSVRGRGPRTYGHSLRKSSQGSPSQHKQSMNSGDNLHHDNQAQTYLATSNVESDSAPMRKNAFGSSLSSASPPFYPSASSNKEVGLSQKQTGNSDRNIGPPLIGDNLSVPNPLLRGKNSTNSVGMDKLCIDDLVSAFGGKSFSHMPAASSGPHASSAQIPHGRSQGRGPATTVGQMAYQSGLPNAQVSKGSSLQVHTTHRGSAPNRVQPSSQQPAHRPGSGSQASSPPKTALSGNSYDTVESETLSESSKSKGALVAKGKDSIQGSGRGSFIYGSGHAMATSGPMGVGGGDQNFPATPAFLPVMQFGGQHPGGIGVPAVGMAFPGYVAQPQLGLGNSEMTWLPVLAGAAGAMGTTYCPPYLTVDGSYHPPGSGQTTASATASKESNTNKPNNESQPPQGPEAVNEEQGQRQNKARRYSEMNFGQ